MPAWFAWAAAAATFGFAKKLVARYLHGTEIPQILEDPPEVRTLVRVTLAEGSPPTLLAALADALGPALGGAIVSDDALRARRPGQHHDIDVVRLQPRGGATYTLELTRAWTGPHLDEPARALLAQIHATLSTHPAVRDVAWHWRQDKNLVVVHALPVAAP